MAEKPQRDPNLAICFMNIKKAAERYLYDADFNKVDEIALEVGANVAMVRDLLKARRAK
jgi:hypothetical protein